VYYGMAAIGEKKTFPAIPVLTNIHHEYFTPSHELIKPDLYPDRYDKGGI